MMPPGGEWLPQGALPTFANQQRNSCGIKNAVRHVSNLVSLSFVHLLVCRFAGSSEMVLQPVQAPFAALQLFIPVHCFRPFPFPSLLTWPREPGA